MNWKSRPAKGVAQLAALAPAVATYILGGTLDNGFEVTPKYIGNGRLIEIAIATLTTDRALLLLGIPGTGKTRVSEHLAAAVSGDSTLLAGHGRNRRRSDPPWLELCQPLIAKGPTPDALVHSPVMIGMEQGVVRAEELTRVPADVQMRFITILSEKIAAHLELNRAGRLYSGFNVIRHGQ